ncbi:FecR family protein [Chitinophaga sp. YR573]|uniref:FecR family protein n=1 Tax=Chitinophaga sp. YR573 TaxID=1881040 RepID=UPI0008BD32EF|nr:FecR domain-containing protein [Chitinophaga sp. YR573]SEV96583.1 FecR family protein [Chitinophaga sp. YR573]
MFFDGPIGSGLRLYTNMPDYPSRIQDLLDRYVNKSCTREELEELFSYIGDERNREVLQYFMEELYQADHTAPDLDFNEIYAQILAPAPAARAGIFSLRRMAAAAIVLLLAGSAYFFLQRKAPEKGIVAVQETDIAPGVNKAVLTLSDGSTVTLDSAGNQVISQGHTTIRKQNGQLLYAAQGDGAGVHYNKLTTPRGGQFKLVLPDGTKVWLNSASTLRYPTTFTGEQRIVELEGQGYFEVAKNALQPFRVMVGNMEVQVLGTDFDVMAYPDETTVNTTLLAGSVRVKEGSALQLLQPGQQAVLDNQRHGITVRTADLKKVTAWKNGLFVFNNMALPAILREVARWYDVDIVYAAKPSEELYGGGIGRNLNLSGVLDLLEGNGYNHFRIEGRKVIVLP